MATATPPSAAVSPRQSPAAKRPPKIDAVDYMQRLQWQGRWLYNRSGVISGAGGERYYTPDHYKSFVPLN